VIPVNKKGEQMEFSVKDAKLIQTKALPNGAANTSIDGFDLKLGPKGDFLSDCELLIEAPVLGVTPLPNSKTMIYSVEHSDTADFASPVLMADRVIVQTGAGGEGDVAKSARFRLPSNVKRFVRVKATGSASGDASTASFTVSIVF
jgi:hypothetical protein